MMISDVFNIHLYTNEVVKNPQMVNTHELRSQFEKIDFNNMYIDLKTLLTTNLVVDWSEFYENFNQSVLFEFLFFISEMNVKFIYNGYSLKMLLLKIVNDFCKRSFPAKTFKLLWNWKTNQLDVNLALKNEYFYQKNYEIDIVEFADLFSKVANVCLKNIENDLNLNLAYRCFYHYFQLIIPNKDFNFIVNKNKFVIRFNYTKKINKSVFLNIDILSQMFSFINQEFGNFSLLNRHNNKSDFKQLYEVEKYMQNLIKKNESFYKWQKLSKNERKELVNEYLKKRKEELKQKYGSFEKPLKESYDFSDDYQQIIHQNKPKYNSDDFKNFQEQDNKSFFEVIQEDDTE